MSSSNVAPQLGHVAGTPGGYRLDAFFSAVEQRDDPLITRLFGRTETRDATVATAANSAVPNWNAGDTIPLGKRTLVVIGKRDDDGDQPPVLVVEVA